MHKKQSLTSSVQIQYLGGKSSIQSKQTACTCVNGDNDNDANCTLVCAWVITLQIENKVAIPLKTQLQV